MKYRVLLGDCIESMRQLPDQSVNCCVTSPPYFGLRDYGVEGQIGLEQRAPEYVRGLVRVFSEVRRVLRDDGVMFVNIGDTYAGFKDGKFPPHSSSNGNQRSMPVSGAPHRCKSLLQLDGYKNKEAMGIPWRFAFAMQEAGWYLRQEIIWSKPNTTPEKVRDRFVRQHEQIFYSPSATAITSTGTLCESTQRAVATSCAAACGRFRLAATRAHTSLPSRPA